MPKLIFIKLVISHIAPKILILLSIIPLTIALLCYYYNSMIIFQWDFLQIKFIRIPIIIIIDTKGIIFSTVVLFISRNVLIFSNLYIKEDKFINRFTILVLLFILSINLLVVTPHLIIILLGWDGLGIVSFILVIYYQNPKSLAAGIITALRNRVGDVFILISIALSLNSGHWFMFTIWESPLTNNTEIICIMLAAITKRAQIPFSRWLPAAIAAPTPVSALVHSSTLVTAGVFLLIRFYPFLHTFYLFNFILITISTITIIISGVCAFIEIDIKKIIALSTLSQLGLMILSLSLNIPNITFMHLVIHALFKALLFICAGVLINIHMHRQDIRWMGNLSNQLPLTRRAIVLASITMSGIPFLSAFYSKDIILEISINSINRAIIITTLYLSLIVTTIYRMRLLYSIVFTPIIRSPYYYLSDKFTSTPTINLSYITIFRGLIFSWLNPNLIISPMPFIFILTPIILLIIGIILSILWLKVINQIKNNLLIFLSYMWFITPIRTQFILKIPFKYSKISLEIVDTSWLEYIGGPLFSSTSKFIYNKKLNHIVFNPIILLGSSVLLSIILITII